MSLNPFQNTFEEAKSIYFQSFSNEVITIKNQSTGEEIEPCGVYAGVYEFKLVPGIYSMLRNGILQNGFGEEIYVIPKEQKPINSINKYLFDYRYAVK